MPKIVKESDNFSSFLWKDLSRESLAFVHQQYFSQEMTVDEYIETYFANKIPNFKHEADRLFEEGKKKCSAEGNFPESLNEVWTKKVIKKLEEKENNKKRFSSHSMKPKDKSAVQRNNYNQKIQQTENELDDFSKASRDLEENNAQFMGQINALLSQSDELTGQTARYDKSQAYQEQSIFLELQQSLFSRTNQEIASIEENGRKVKLEKEERLEKLYQERNNLEW